METLFRGKTKLPLVSMINPDVKKNHVSEAAVASARLALISVRTDGRIPKVTSMPLVNPGGLVKPIKLTDVLLSGAF